MGREKKKKDNNYYRPNGWRFLIDIFTSLIAKAQLPVLLFGLIILVLVLKCSQKDASTLLFKILSIYELHFILGWILTVVLALGWYFSLKRTRRIHASEMDRVTKEKTELQNKLLGKLTGSKNNG